MKKTCFLLMMTGLLMVNALAQKGSLNPADRLQVGKASDPFLAREMNDALNLFRSLDGGVIRQATGIPTFSKQDFDLANLYKGYIQGEDITALVAPYKGSSGKVIFAFAVFRNHSGYGKPMLIKAYQDRSLLTYYDLEEGQALTIERNGKQFTYKRSALPAGFSHPQVRRGGCGQSVMDCVTDAYTSHGWASVWATIQSAFIPATSAAIIGGCILRSCVF